MDLPAQSAPTSTQTSTKTNDSVSAPPTLVATPSPSSPVSVGQTAIKEPGNAPGPCPSAPDQLRQLLANALELEKKTTDPEPHRAIAEVVRMRLDALFQHGCHRRLNDEQLVEVVAQLAPDPKDFAERLDLINRGDLGILSTYGTYAGGYAAQYHWHDGMIRTSILVTGEQGDLDKQLFLLTAKLVKFPSYPEPVLVLGNTHPWMASCWRDMRIRVLAPSGDPLRPKALLDKPKGGRWCEGIKTTVQGDTVSFSFEDWGGPWSFAQIQRSYTYTYQYEGRNLVEHFGFPARIEDLPEDWLMREWTLAQEATVESARERLQGVHAQMHKALIDHRKANPISDNSEYTQEMFPVSDAERRIALYCAQRETKKPCKQWPKAVDFIIERRNGLWYVKDVIPRK